MAIRVQALKKTCTYDPRGNEAELCGIAKGAGINFLGKIFSALFQYVYLIVISKILGASILGGFLLGLTVINFAALISRLGLDVGVIKFVAQYCACRDMKRVKGVVTVALIISGIAGVVIALLIFCNATFLSDFFSGKPSFKQVIKVLSLTIPMISLMWITLSATQGAKIMKYTTYAQHLTLPMVNLSVVLLLYWFGLKLDGVVAAFVISTIIVTLLSFLFLGRTFPLWQQIQPIFEVKALLSVSMPLFLVVFLNFGLLWTDTIMLGYFKSSAEVGIYNVVVKTALLISMILTSFNAIFAPVISDLHSRNQLRRLESLFKTVTKWILVISLPVFSVMTVLSSNILSLFGPDFVHGARSLQILAFAQLVNAGVGSVGFILAMTGRQQLVMLNTLIIFLVNVGLNYCLIPQYGMIGAATASGTATILLNLLMLIEVGMILRITPFNSQFFKVLALGVAIFILMLLAKLFGPQLNNFFELILYPVIFARLFFLLFLRWGAGEEDTLILSMIKSKIPLVRSLSG